MLSCWLRLNHNNGVFQSEAFSQNFLGESSSICVSAWAGLYPSRENVYDYRNVFVVTAFVHLYKIHLQIYKGNAWFWVCCNFGFDPSSDVMDQTNRTSAAVLLCSYRGIWGKPILYCCNHPPLASASHQVGHTSKVREENLRYNKVVIWGAPQGIKV